MQERRKSGSGRAFPIWWWVVCGLCTATIVTTTLYLTTGHRSRPMGVDVSTPAGVHVDTLWRPTVDLPSGAKMPRVGLGMAGVGSGETVRELVASAYGLGYRGFDTAAQDAVWYGNEVDVGEAVDTLARVKGGDPVFVTTKLHPAHHGPGSAARAIRQSLVNLGVETIDLFLIHYPECWGDICQGMDTPDGDWRDSWKVMESAVAAGIIKSIGVSNFSPAQLDELASFTRVPVSVVQSRFDLLAQDHALVQKAADIGAVFTAYSPTGGQYWSSPQNPILTHPTVVALARSLDITPAQLALRYLLDIGLTVIPRSTNPKHMRENIAVLTLPKLSPDVIDQLRHLEAPEPARPSV